MCRLVWSVKQNHWAYRKTRQFCWIFEITVCVRSVNETWPALLPTTLHTNVLESHLGFPLRGSSLARLVVLFLSVLENRVLETRL